MRATSGATADMKMISPFTYTYMAGSKLPEETGRAHVFRAELVGSAQEVLQLVAGALDVDGKVREAEYSTKEYPSYQIGSQEGSGKSVSVTWTGTGNWWYSNSAAYPAQQCQATDEAGYCQQYAEAKPTPELLPTRTEAQTTAARLFAATGFKVAAADIDVQIDEWSAWAHASMSVDGISTPIEWSVNWSQSGVVSSVSGHSVRLVDAGEFDTVSAKAAVARAGDWRYSGSMSTADWNKYQRPVTVQPLGGDDAASVDASVATDQPAVEGAPDATPTPILVTLNEAHRVNLMIWDSAGGVWVVPGWLLISDEGSLLPVFSLPDGLIALPEATDATLMTK